MASNGYLEAMGISVWRAHRNLPFAKQIIDEAPENEATFDPTFDPTLAPTEIDSQWNILQTQVAQCVACKLCQSRTNTVFGAGSTQADLMIIGEAPKEEEEASGTPFMGVVENILTHMLSAIELSRENIFITNLVKCRPPENRDPQQEEIASCHGFLLQQINFIKPKIILAMGRVAAQNLLQTKETISHLRGNTYTFADTQIPLVATFHPAYLLRSPTEKSKAWIDLVNVQKILKDSK